MSICLKPSYCYLLKNIPLYSKKGRRVAEIDLLGVNEDYYDVYEVKCSYRLTKAKRQLTKIKKILADSSKVRNTYFYCGELNKLMKL